MTLYLFVSKCFKLLVILLIIKLYTRRNVISYLQENIFNLTEKEVTGLNVVKVFNFFKLIKILDKVNYYNTLVFETSKIFFDIS